MSAFDPAQFVNRIGQRLVWEFADASEAGTPGLIGSAREHPARMQLVKLLPTYVSIGTGLLIDSDRGQSKQQDIVMFERDFCPVYSINDDPNATYFPIEGVIANGEVKSSVNKSVLFEALDNIRSAKSLRRYVHRTDEGLGHLASFRNFGMAVSFAATPSDEFNQDINFRDQIYSFILCNSFTNSPDAVLNNLVEYQRRHGHECMPNIIISLNNGFIQGMQSNNMSLQFSLLTSDSFSFVPEKDRCFAYLVNELRQHVREARTVPLQALDRYMISLNGALPSCRARRFEIR
ncbi:DUF6602 domain-containing protein [Argonema galeatum]|uniref:DUF6602 domain-containing protein n=1 Tax=Argonema galeatum TaxID=2942762 RepID=UPI0020114D6A|nr:DUF6602 domain-containing protein [Argonema galeatum]MCL1468980.1 hypothetical protein [Argonema galeatum A003/A1]